LWVPDYQSGTHPLARRGGKAINAMKPGKAAGPDEFPAELLKFGEGTVIKAMHKNTGSRCTCPSLT